jgi:putative ABC transport system permease protein
MWSFAWSNLLTRPLRTILALVGLSVPILGVLGLFSLSGGLRNLVGDTLSQIQGVMVLRENAPSPVFSDLRADLVATLRRVPGVRVVAPEVWKISPPIGGKYLIRNLSSLTSKQGIAQSLLDANVIQGQDITEHRKVKSAVFPKALKEGRYLRPEDRNQPHIVISRKIAAEHKDSEGRPKRVGDELKIGEKMFTIIGIYETGSMFLDVVVIMDIETARELLNLGKTQVSCFYVEATDPGRIERVTQAIESAVPGIDARSMQEFQANFGMIMGQLDTFLLMTVSLALVVGIVGIVNTMLMSTTERFAEFGILRTNGWSQANVLSLITAESAYLGLPSGILGCVLAILGTAIANQFISGGLQLTVTPRLIVLGLGLSILMGMLGGLYPAWRAARLVPMEAIRLGAR